MRCNHTAVCGRDSNGSPSSSCGNSPRKNGPATETESVGCWLMQKLRESWCAQVQAKSGVVKNELPFCSRISCSNVGTGPSVFPTFDGDRRYCASERTRVLPDTVLSLGSSRAGLSNEDYDLAAVFFAAVVRYLRRIASRSWRPRFSSSPKAMSRWSRGLLCGLAFSRAVMKEPSVCF